jgi:membrane associated rhomboid family serine protease
MNNYKYYPALVSAFAAAVLTTIPGLKSFACCLIVPAASVLALYLDQKFNSSEKQITSNKAMLVGLITGVLIAFFSSSLEIFITFILKSNELTLTLPELEVIISQMELGNISEEIVEMLRNISKEITESGFSAQFTFFLITSNLITNAIFGFLGGLLGMAILNKQNSNKEL